VISTDAAATRTLYREKGLAGTVGFGERPALLVVDPSVAFAAPLGEGDARPYDFRTIVPCEAVGDRAPGPHEANLLDKDAKYADVVALVDVLDSFRARFARSA